MSEVGSGARVRRRAFRTWLPAVLATFATLGIGEDARAGAASMHLASATFSDGAVAPKSAVYSGRGGSVCRGGNRSPAFSWSYVPRGTASLALVTYDVDARFTHWGLYDVSPDARGVPANAGASGTRVGRTIVNDYGRARYDGPCPPPGPPHHYVTTLYALDATISLPNDAHASELDAALRSHTIETAHLTFTYRR